MKTIGETTKAEFFAIGLISGLIIGTLISVVVVFSL